MKKILSPSFVMQRDSKPSNIAYTIVAVLVALAMFIAASGAGSDDFVIEQPLPDWFNIGANLLAILIGMLVLIPHTRIIGAILAVVQMFLSMYINYAVVGIEFFAVAIPYNTVTIMLGSTLMAHYFADIPFIFRPSHSASNHQVTGVLS
ncbi:MAG: hypothetical protein AAF485_22440 [Chloroflexota bacterium]